MRKEVINNTIGLFNEKGTRFTMDDLANSLRISKRTLYTHISSKEALCRMIVEEVFSEIKLEEKKIMEDSNLDDLEKLKRVLIVLPKSMARVDYSKIYEIRDTYPDVYDYIEERIENDWEDTILLVKLCIEKGYIRNIDIPLFKYMITTSVENLLNSDYLRTVASSYEDTLERVLEVIFCGLET